MKLGEAYIEISGQLDKLDASLKTAETKVKSTIGSIEERLGKVDFGKLGKQMTIAGAGITGTLTLMMKNFIKAGDEMDKMSLRTGFSAEALSELKYAAEISGSDINELEIGIKKMAGTILDASEGMETYQRAFKRIGIEIEDLMSLSPEKQFLAIAEAIERVEDPTIRAATAQDIFGRSGTKLLPLFSEGAGGLKSLREEALKTGNVFSTEGATSAANLNDAFTTLKASIGGLSKELAESLVPIIQGAVERITDIIQKIKDWVENNPALAKGLMEVAGALGVMLAVTGPLTVALVGLKVAGGPLTIILGAIAAAITGVVLAFKNWDKIVDWVEGVFDKVVKVLQVSIENMKKIGLWIVRNFPNFFIDAFNAVKAAVINFGKNIGEYISAIARKITHPFEKIEWPEWTPLLEGFEATVEKFPEMTKVAFEKTKKAVKDSAKEIEKTIEGIDTSPKPIKWSGAVLPPTETPSTSFTPSIEMPTENILRLSDSVKNSLYEIQSAYEETFASITLSLGEALDIQAKDWIDSHSEMLNGMIDIASAMGNVYESFLGYRKQTLENEMNAEIDAVVAREEAGAISAETAESKIALIREKYRKKEEEAAKNLKPLKVAQAISNTALGVTQALASTKFPFSLIAAALVAAAGAAEIATIKAQPYAKGGLVNKPTVALLGEAGTERVLSPQETKEYNRIENAFRNIGNVLPALKMPTIGPLEIPIVPFTKAQLGGLFTKPTIAMIGEAGAERVLSARETREYERRQALNVTFNVSAIDAKSFEKYIFSDGRTQIISLIKDAERRREL